MQYLTAVPAYGRDYKNKKEVLADWDANKDFTLQPQGVYINKPQLTKDMTLNIRYSKLTKVVVVKGK